MWLSENKQTEGYRDANGYQKVYSILKDRTDTE